MRQNSDSLSHPKILDQSFMEGVASHGANMQRAAWMVL